VRRSCDHPLQRGATVAEREWGKKEAGAARAAGKKEWEGRSYGAHGSVEQKENCVCAEVRSRRRGIGNRHARPRDARGSAPTGAHKHIANGSFPQQLPADTMARSTTAGDDAP